ncbi:MAG TPA: hypothetical protein VMS43_10030 [Allosphingosinicella sp.]|nr:hypothetical protein [Allosphingosinicella sp.]
MKVSIARLGVAAAALLGAGGATAQEDLSQANWGRPPPRTSVMPLDKPPCVDGAMLGTLSRGPGEMVDDRDGSFHGGTRYWYDFRPERVLFGLDAPQSVRFAVLGDARIALGDNVVLLVRREAGGALGYVHADVAVPDRGNRRFIPLVWAPLRRFGWASWLPPGYGRFARSVRYWDSAMYRAGHDAAFLAGIADAGDFNQGWVIRRDGRAVVARGIYLDSLAALFSRQRPASCWRPAPSLANPDPSR